jgi:hypothetical protein
MNEIVSSLKSNMHWKQPKHSNFWKFSDEGSKYTNYVISIF